MRTLLALVAISVVCAVPAGTSFAAPLSVDVQIFNGTPGNLAPDNLIGQSVDTNAISASASLADAAFIARGTGTFADNGLSASLFNQSIIGSGGRQGGPIGVADVPGSFRVQTMTTGVITRAALNGSNDLTLNIINTALELRDPAEGASAILLASIDVTTANGTLVYTLSASLTNDTPPGTIFSEGETIVGSVNTNGPNFGGFNNGTLFISPGYTVTFHLGSLQGGSLIFINYMAITAVTSPHAPVVFEQGSQQLRSQFGDPTNQGVNDLDPRVTPSATVAEVPEPSSLALGGMCAVVGLFAARRRRAT